MKKELWVGVLLFSAVSLALAQSPFNGTWKYDLSTIQWIGHGEARGEILLHDGLYDCQLCDPLLKVKADGADWKITGNAERDGVTVDAVNVKAVDDRNLEVTYKKD